MIYYRNSLKFCSKILMLIALLAVIVLSSTNVQAQNEIQVYINQDKVSFDVPPQIISGRTMLPLRTIFESLGASVEWDAKTSTVSAIKGDFTIELTINKQTAVVNGETISLDVPALIVEGRTMVPVRFVSESFGMKVDWDSKSSTINISEDLGVIVHSEEDLQKALASNKKIVIDLDYINIKEPIKISNVENLTIEGNKKSRVKVALENSDSDVMIFENCKNIVLKNLEIGHLYSGNCGGGVISVNKSNTILIDNCLLYGSGTFGLNVDDSKNITVLSSVNEKCTDSLINLHESDNILFKNSILRETNVSNPLIGVNQSRDVVFDSCEIYDNNYSDAEQKGIIFNVTLPDNNSTSAHKVKLINTKIYDNTQKIVFNDKDNVKTESCEIQGEASLMSISDKSELSSSIFNNLKEVTVKTGDDFLKAIASNTKVIIDVDEISLDKSKNNNGILTIKNVENIVITTKTNHRAKLTAIGYGVGAISFENCKNVLVKNLYISHIYPAYAGGAVTFEKCDSVFIENCMIKNFAYGVASNASKNINITDTVIRLCGEESAISFVDTNSVKVNNVIIKENNSFESIVKLNKSQDVVFDSCEIYSNNLSFFDEELFSGRGSIFEIKLPEGDSSSKYKLKISNSKVYNNKIEYVYKYKDTVEAENSTIQREIGE